MRIGLSQILLIPQRVGIGTEFVPDEGGADGGGMALVLADHSGYLILADGSGYLLLES